MVKIAIGSIGDSFSAGSLKAYLAEFIATLLFVFAGVGSAIAFSKFLRKRNFDYIRDTNVVVTCYTWLDI